MDGKAKFEALLKGRDVVCCRLITGTPTGSELLRQTMAKVKSEVRLAGEIVERLRDFPGRSEPRWHRVDLTAMTRKVVGALATWPVRME